MAIISIINQKGGVAKTTTVINLAYILTKYYGLKVLVIDCDPQHNTTITIGVLPPHDFPVSLLDVLEDDNIDIEKCIFNSKFENLDLIASNLNLFGWQGRSTNAFYALKDHMTKSIIDKYDFILIDCPPNIDSLVNNALTVSDYYIIPIKAEDYYALKGVKQLESHIHNIKNNMNSNLELLGVVITMYDGRTNLGPAMSIATRNYFPKGFVFETMIRVNTDINKATTKNVPVCKHKKNCIGCQDYMALAEEILGRLGK